MSTIGPIRSTRKSSSSCCQCKVMRGRPLAVRTCAMKHNALVQRFLERGIPFNDHLGIEVERLEVGVSVMRLPMRPELVGDPFRPAVHGGVISTLADTCGGLAAFTALRDDQVASTLDLRVDYLLPGNVELDLWAVSRVIRAGSRACPHLPAPAWSEYVIYISMIPISHYLRDSCSKLSFMTCLSTLL